LRGFGQSIESVPVTEDLHFGPAADLVWTHYHDSDDWVVFHPQSGDVCLVTSAAHILWTLIADGGASTLPQLVSALAAVLERAPDEELAAVTRDTLAFMDRAGLVRPISL
jgi:PqqD family protein of HPr-rel-A system